MKGRIKNIQRELDNIIQAALAAHIAGDKARADCLTGKAVGMKTTLEIAERSLDLKDGSAAVGELEGMDRALTLLRPLRSC